MSIRLGVLGGMFDPVHNGHIEVARFAQRMLGLDILQLVPCHIPNHRNAAISSPADRLAMLQLAVTGCSGLSVNPIELNRNQVSYTIDTVTALRANADIGSLILVLGMDAFNGLPQWHEWQKLFELCHLFIVPRSGETVITATADALDLDCRRVHSAAEMFAADTGKVLIAEDFRVDLSSTMVREAIRNKYDLSGLLDVRVIEYIFHNKLYITDV